MKSHSRQRRLAALALGLALVGAGCGDGAETPGPEPRSRPEGDLVAQVANHELVAREESRFLIGLLTIDNLFVTAGTAELRFSFLAEGAGPELYREEVAFFLPIPGEEPGHEHAQAGPPSEGRGVYVVLSIVFDRPGFWQVQAIVDLGNDDVRSGIAAFEVLSEPEVPAVGERAPLTENLTLDSNASPAAVDSRAQSRGEIPDPELHETTIADAIRAGRPPLAIFSTPVFCISQFCGPITEMVEGLAHDFGDRAAFIHVEIWRDHQEGVINQAAADWLLRDENLTEPWVFLIGADGRIAARWDNVATREEIEPLLRQLPTS
ncbi:MAG: hypothetical protein ACRDH6_06210 [Actinomycetota bacterium]